MNKTNKKMKIINKLIYLLALFLTIIGLNGCDDDLQEFEEIADAPYVLSLGITSGGATTYYVVTTDNLMSGNINAIGKGIEQNGYHDYEQGNQTIFSIGGLGITNAVGIIRNSNGYIEEKGNFVFNSSLAAFTQITSNSMLGIEIPANPQSGNQITFYEVDINNVAIKNKKHADIQPISQFEWPSITGLCQSEGNVYVTYFGLNPTTYETPYTDTTYVAVYSYPEMTFKTIMKDTRTGPAGSWYAHNGIFQVENGDMYIMSNSALANGYSQSTKHAGFLRIPKGQTYFDPAYFFDFESVSGGLKPAHIKYIGNGLLFAEVSTLNPQTINDRWSDKSLKCCIIDLNKKTVKDVTDIPIHNGNGGRRFTVLVDGGFVYLPVKTADGTYIYKVDPISGNAEKGAKISTTFVGGFFKLN